MIYVYFEDICFKEEIRYVFDTILFILGIELNYIENLNEFNPRSEGVLIIYFEEYAFQKICNSLPDKFIFINKSQKLFGKNYLKSGSIPKVIQKIVLDKPIKEIEDIISIYNNGKANVYYKDNNTNNVIIDADIISDIFFMLSRYEEYFTDKEKRNKNYDRFPVYESLAFKHGFLDRPIVNEYVELIWKYIHELNSNIIRKKWWGDKDFAVCLSHDVDWVQKYRSLKDLYKVIIKLLLFKQDLIGAIIKIPEYIKSRKNIKNNPYWTFEYIFDVEKNHGLKSTFYLMSGGTSKFDNRYDIKSREVRNLISNMEKLGHEVGYHGSFNSYNDIDLMKNEIKTLGDIFKNKTYGCRQHFLRFDLPNTWVQQAECGILYDSSLSYAESEGFRCGICSPYRPFNVFEKKIIDIWEIPLIIMDSSIQDKKYRNLKPEKGLESSIKLANLAKKYNGVFTLLWHNSCFCDEWKDWVNVYEGILNYLATSNSVSYTGSEIVSLLMT